MRTGWLLAIALAASCSDEEELIGPCEKQSVPIAVTTVDGRRTIAAVEVVGSCHVFYCSDGRLTDGGEPGCAALTIEADGNCQVVFVSTAGERYTASITARERPMHAWYRCRSGPDVYQVKPREYEPARITVPFRVVADAGAD